MTDKIDTSREAVEQLALVLDRFVWSGAGQAAHALRALLACAEEAEAKADQLQAEMDACADYLKEHQTPAERLELNHREILVLMKIMAREKKRAEAAEAKLAAARSALSVVRRVLDSLDDLTAAQAARVVSALARLDSDTPARPAPVTVEEAARVLLYDKAAIRSLTREYRSRVGLSLGLEPWHIKPLFALWQGSGRMNKPLPCPICGGEPDVCHGLIGAPLPVPFVSCQTVHINGDVTSRCPMHADGIEAWNHICAIAVKHQVIPALIDGVKAGLEAATSAAFKSCRANDAGYIDENSRLLQRAENEMRLEVVKSIRALDPVAIARAAQKEGE